MCPKTAWENKNQQQQQMQTVLILCNALMQFSMCLFVSSFPPECLRLFLICKEKELFYSALLETLVHNLPIKDAWGKKIINFVALV